MSISSEIQRISGKISDSFDAVVAKGGTVTTRKIADLPTAIETISGGTPATKYGASVDALLGDVDANGVLQAPTGAGDLVFNGVELVKSSRRMCCKFYCASGITSITFPDLKSIGKCPA